jgi:hypothetical protein
MEISNSVRSPYKRPRSPGVSDSALEPQAESKAENAKPPKPELTLANIKAYMALCEAEEQLTALPMREYMSTQQPSVTPCMRLILFNWLVEVHQHRRMNPETLHMTFSLVDRFLSRVPVTRGTLQLVGSVAWMLASKFEEVCAPTVSQVVEMAAGAYSAQQVRVSEWPSGSFPSHAHLSRVTVLFNSLGDIRIENCRWGLKSCLCPGAKFHSAAKKLCRGAAASLRTVCV